jgi:hypothetical protein
MSSASKPSGEDELERADRVVAHHAQTAELDVAGQDGGDEPVAKLAEDLVKRRLRSPGFSLYSRCFL